MDIIRALRTRMANRILAIRRAQDDADAGIDIAGRGDDLEDEEVEANFRMPTKDGGASSIGGGSNAQAALRKAEDDLNTAINSCRNRNHNALVHSMGGGGDDDDEEGSGGKGCCDRRSRKVASEAGAGGAPGKPVKKRHYGRQTSQRSTMLLAMLWPIMAYLG